MVRRVVRRTDGRRQHLSAVRTRRRPSAARPRAAGIRYSERRGYDTLFNGFSVEVDPADRAKLAQGGVKAMYPVDASTRRRPKAVPACARPGRRDQADRRQHRADRGLPAEASRSASSIPASTSITRRSAAAACRGTTPFPNAASSPATTSSATATTPAGSRRRVIPAPDTNPDDCAGHGTHVAGIVGANGGGIIGVAPQVKLRPPTASSAAPARPTRTSCRGARASAGRRHAGHQPEPRLGSSVAAVPDRAGRHPPGQQGRGDGGLDRQQRPRRLVARRACSPPAPRAWATRSSASPRSTTRSARSRSPARPTASTRPPARRCRRAAARCRCQGPGTPTTADRRRAASRLPAGSLTGKAVLIRRGTCGFYIKACNAQNAGAAAVVLYNNAAGALNARPWPVQRRSRSRWSRSPRPRARRSTA